MSQDIKVTWDKNENGLPVRVTTTTTVDEVREVVDFSGLQPVIQNLEMAKRDIQEVIARKTDEVASIDTQIAKTKETQLTIVAAFPDIQETINKVNNEKTPVEPVLPPNPDSGDTGTPAVPADNEAAPVDTGVVAPETPVEPAGEPQP